MTSICIEGPTLSTLILNHFCNSEDGKQYGFLLGEKTEHIEDKISDSQTNAYNVKTYLLLSSFLPWPRKSVGDGLSHFEDDLTQYLSTHHEQNIVGWYSLRLNSSHRPSLRETTIHQMISSHSRFSSQSQDFIFLLCTSSPSEESVIQTCNFGIHSRKDESFVSLPVTILNLGDTTRTEYRKSSTSTFAHSHTVQGFLGNFQTKVVTASGEVGHVVHIKQMTSCISNSLMSVYHEVADSEQVLGSLEDEVAQLRQQLKVLEQEDMERTLHLAAETRIRQADEEIRSQHAKQEAAELEQLNQVLRDVGLLGVSGTPGVTATAPGNLLAGSTSSQAGALSRLDKNNSGSSQADHVTPSTIDQLLSCEPDFLAQCAVAGSNTGQSYIQSVLNTMHPVLSVPEHPRRVTLEPCFGGSSTVSSGTNSSDNDIKDLGAGISYRKSDKKSVRAGVSSKDNITSVNIATSLSEKHASFNLLSGSSDEEGVLTLAASPVSRVRGGTETQNVPSIGTQSTNNIGNSSGQGSTVSGGLTESQELSGTGQGTRLLTDTRVADNKYTFSSSPIF